MLRQTLLALLNSRVNAALIAAGCVDAYANVQPSVRPEFGESRMAMAANVVSFMGIEYTAAFGFDGHSEQN